MALIKGLSFSLKRAIGISGLRRSIASKIGIPTTRSGLERKIGRVVLDKFDPKKINNKH